jgi:hypothetical protein
LLLYAHERVLNMMQWETDVKLDACELCRTCWTKSKRLEPANHIIVMGSLSNMEVHANGFCTEHGYVINKAYHDNTLAFRSGKHVDEILIHDRS